MCKTLNVPRSSYYYESKAKKDESILESTIKEIFITSRRNYGTRKIKKELEKQGYQISRRRIGRIMKSQGLVSRYTVAQYKVHKETCNESEITNKVNREFSKRDYLDVAVSDLTYVRVGQSWNYICIIIDLFNREIIGFSTGRNKDSELVVKAFSRIKVNLQKIRIFHTDRGNEFKNKIIDDLLGAFKIDRSLSMKGCPYDNAVAEATFKLIKTEFVKGEIFNSLNDLDIEFADYVNWFNKYRIHSSLGYMSPIKFKYNTHINFV